MELDDSHARVCVDSRILSSQMHRIVFDDPALDSTHSIFSFVSTTVGSRLESCMTLRMRAIASNAFGLLFFNQQYVLRMFERTAIM
jgi:hypothetical protein